MSDATHATRLIGINNGSHVQHRDSVMDAGFVSHNDFASDYVRNYSPAYSSGAIPAAHAFKNLVDEGADTVVVDPFAELSVRGLIMNGSGYARLPDICKVPTDCAEFMFGMTIWNDPAATYGASESGYLGGYGYQNSTDCVFSFTYSADASGKLASITARSTSSGAVYNSANVASAATVLNAGAPIFLMQHWKKVDATHFNNALYVNGAQAVAQNNVAFSGALTNPAGKIPIIGCPTASTTLTGYQKTLRGAIGRTWLKIMANDSEGISAADVAAQEYAKYGPGGAARFVP